MAQFQVDSEQVLAANATIQATIGRLQTEVTNLHTQLQGLSSSWRGVAADGFQDLAMRWRNTAATVDAQLADLGQVLSFAAQQYEEIEQANARLFLAR